MTIAISNAFDDEAGPSPFGNAQPDKPRIPHYLAVAALLATGITIASLVIANALADPGQPTPQARPQTSYFAYTPTT